MTLLLGLSACEGFLGTEATATNPGQGSSGGTTSGGAAGASSTPAASEACSPHRRLRKLSPDQFDATIRALQINAPSAAQRLRDTLSLSDATFSSYASRLDMGQPHVSEIAEAAKSLAASAIVTGGPAESCALASAPVDCARDFLASFGKVAFRRPLTPEELSSYADYYAEQRKLDDAATSLTSVLRVLFMSPSFLFRSELGEQGDGSPTLRMTQYEIASSIAYYLTDAPPDALLSAAAEKAELGTPVSRAPHVRRLLGEGALGSGLSRFFGEYFRTAAVGSVSARDAAIYPDFNSDIARDFGLETQAFISEVMMRDDARLSTLLTAPYVMVTARTAPYYGIGGVSSEVPIRQNPPADQRAGIFTQASWLTRFAHDKEGSPVSRGRFIRERLMCDAVPPPPPSVNAATPPPDGQRTQRERLKSHNADPGCAACHVLMDSIGLAFENYDAVGRYRATELDRPIDATGTLQDSAGVVYDFSDGRDLARQLASSPVVQACFSKQVFLYAQGLSNDDGGNCAYASQADGIAYADGSITDMIVQTVSADAFFIRSREAE